jgi:hypothetical protein
MKETLRDMLIEFFIILSGTTICAAVFCTVFYPGVTLGVSILWQVIILAFLTSLLQLIFYSKKELSKRQLRIRQAIHLILVVGLIIFLAYTWGWIEFGSIIEPVAFIALVLLSYTGIALFMYRREKKLVKVLNEKLQKFKEIKED